MIVKGTKDLVRISKLALAWVPDGGTACPGLYLWWGWREDVAVWVLRLMPWFGMSAWARREEERSKTLERMYSGGRG